MSTSALISVQSLSIQHDILTLLLLLFLTHIQQSYKLSILKEVIKVNLNDQFHVICPKSMKYELRLLRLYHVVRYGCILSYVTVVSFLV